MSRFERGDGDWTESDLAFVEHAMRARIAMLIPRHQEMLRTSRTLARAAKRVIDAQGVSARTHALRQQLVLLEERLVILEGREGKVSMPIVAAPRMYPWSEETQITG
jgi:hypothetical protein